MELANLESNDEIFKNKNKYDRFTSSNQNEVKIFEYDKSSSMKILNNNTCDD